MFVMTVKGLCNGPHQFTSRKTGVVYNSVLLSVPNQSSCLQIGVESEDVAKSYKQGEVVEIRIKPRIFNGSLQGLERCN